MSIFDNIGDEFKQAFGRTSGAFGGTLQEAVRSFIPPAIGTSANYGRYAPPRIGGAAGSIASIFGQRFGGMGIGGFGGAAPRPIGGSIGFAAPRMRGSQPTAAEVAANKPATKPTTGTGPMGTGAAKVEGMGSSAWADMINEEAAKYTDAPELAEMAQALIEYESNGRAEAQGVVVTEGAYAGQRAQGLGQIMPGNYPGVNLLDPRTNIQKTLEMMHQRYTTWKDWDKVFASYLGALDENGNITAAVDDNGTGGNKYINEVRANLTKIQAAKARAGATGGSGAAFTTRTGIAKLDDAIANLQGTPYTFGGIRNTGNPRDGMDCSSFAGYALGFDRALWNAQTLHDNTTQVAYADMRVGDLVYFQGTTDNDPSAKPVTHVGVYLGGGKMIHTGGAPGLTVVDLNTDYWRSHYYASGRKK